MSTNKAWTVRRGADFGPALAEVRAQRGLTQAEVAEKATIDRSYLARMESGRSARLLDHYLHVLRTLGADVTITWTTDDAKAP